MDLSDVLYIIDGSLEVVPPDSPGTGYEAVLYDNIHDPCMLRSLKPEPGSPWKFGQARARGPTEQSALEALASLIAGDTLGHDWPVMWKSVTEWTRIPPTLIAGNPTIKLPMPEKAPAG